MEEGPGFVQRKSQVIGPYFGHLASCAQPGQGDQRIAARREQQVQLRRRLGQKTIDEAVDQGVVDDVVILQDDEEVAGYRVYHLVDEDHQETLPLGYDVLAILKQRARRSAKPGEAAGDACHKIFEKDGGVVIAGVQLIPRHRHGCIRRELGQQRSLAITGWRGDQDQRFVAVGLQQIQQPRTKQCIASGFWDVELGLQQHDVNHL